MKKLAILLLLLIITPNAVCEVTAKAYLADGITPLELADPCVPHQYRDIMVGTELVIVIDSNVAEPDWSGAIDISEPYSNYGVVYGRGDDPNYPEDSVLPAAGMGAFVEKYPYETNWFDLYTDTYPQAGDWFIFDYNAVEIGDCNVGLYYWDWEYYTPYLIHYLEFTHVQTRDFDNSGRVDFGDFSAFASWWKTDETCDEQNNFCGKSDLNENSYVDEFDLMQFSQFWLVETR
ncbi:MAG: hypothetical protein PHF37_07600 [Phycisphaerae bacterium]|nr:hypothetical protein [Phycisphaerae bacterium]